VLFRRNDVLMAIERKPAPGSSADKGASRTPRPV
jgi:hypothetical protein